MSKNKNTKFNLMDGVTYRLWRTCSCGCGELVRSAFAQGHDARYHGAENRLKLSGVKHPTEEQVQKQLRIEAK